MHRFFIPSSAVDGSRIVICGKDAHHIKNVLRMKPGEQFLACTEKGELYTCEIISTGEKIDTSIVDFSKAASELPCRVVLFQCLPKKDKMEFVIQKAVELGASEVVPVISERTIIKLDEKKKAARLERWNTIAKNAAEQSGRSIIPEVSEPVPFKRALDISSKCDIKIQPYENAEGMERTRKVFASLKPGMTVGVIIGPEGGFSENEVCMAEEAGFQTVTLGRRILRTETAGLTALSFIVFNIET